jgi:protein PET100
MAGPNLEVFKFGMYILFPIGIMYYFGTNLDQKFSVPDFWPKENQTHKIPFDRDEIQSELERLKARRLALRQKRLEEEARLQGRNDDNRP